MRRRDIIFICAILLIALLLALATSVGKEKNMPAAVIYVGNEIYKKVYMDHEETVVISRGGNRNEVHITKDYIEMHSSTCANQICVHQGQVAPNYGDLFEVNWIICMPNGVSVEIVMGDE